MPNLNKIFFLVFSSIFLIFITSSYSLTTEEDARLDKESEYIQKLQGQESDIAKEFKEGEGPAEGSKASNQTQANSSQKTVTLDIKGMDIIDVLKLLANQGNINIVTGKNVTGRVSMFLKDVDVWDAFEIIIAANGLAYEKKGGIINVMSDRDYELIYGDKFTDKKILSTKKIKYASAKDLSVALNQIKSAIGRVIVDESSNTLILLDVPERISVMDKIIEDTDLPIELETKVFSLNYAESDKLKEQFQEVLTKNLGIIKTDARTNKIVVTDTPDKIVRIEEIINAFDEKTRQVLIEAKIIQVSLSDAYKMGIDWKYVFGKEANWTTFNINRALDTSGSQIILGSATPVSAGDLRVIIDALKTFGDVKTLSTPRITATNGQEAKILVGSKEVYVESTIVQGSSSTTTSDSVKFVDVGVKLYVTPVINKDNFITMKIRPEVSSASRFYTTGGRNVPIVETSEAETSVLVKDGVSIIMGGLMKNQNNKSVSKLPILGDIPLLGLLFRRTEDSVTKTELVIFLTPHIISGAENIINSDK